jgi:putative tricarboxylic transport membrane protein
LDAPTIIDSGINVSLSNWRAVFAPPDIDDAARAGIIDAITAMHDSTEWQSALESNGWTDFFQTGDDFAGFLENERTRIEGVLRDIGLIQ